MGGWKIHRFSLGRRPAGRSVGSMVHANVLYSYMYGTRARKGFGEKQGARRTSSLNDELGFAGSMRGIITLRMIVFTHRSVDVADVALGTPTAAPAPTPEANLSLPATAAAAVCAATSAVGAETDDPAEAELQRITNNNNAKGIEWAMGTGDILTRKRGACIIRGRTEKGRNKHERASGQMVRLRYRRNSCAEKGQVQRSPDNQHTSRPLYMYEYRYLTSGRR